MNHTPDVDWAEAVENLDRAAALSLPTDRAVVDWLVPRDGSRVADVGCGAGGMVVLFAAAVGAHGAVDAVDGEPALLAAATRRCADAGVGDRVTTTRHDLGDGPVPIAAADLVWAAGVVHHLPDQQRVVDQLASLLGPGGRLALAEGGLPVRYLPWDVGVGEPGLEDRLGAAEQAWFTAMRRDLDGARRTPYGWPGVLAAAGLAEVTARSFLLDLPAPLDTGMGAHVVESLRVRVERVGDRLPAADRSAWQRLLDPDGADHLGHRDDVHCLSVTTVHVGVRP